MKIPISRRCERSEAIQSAAKSWIASSQARLAMTISRDCADK
jgi:hypothetical protein